MSAHFRTLPSLERSAIWRLARKLPLALNVDLDTTLTVIAGNLYRLLARSLKRYEHMTPERIYRHFIDTTGTLDVTQDGVTVSLTRRTFTPVLLQAGFDQLDLPIPWWGDRRLRFRFR